MTNNAASVGSPSSAGHFLPEHNSACERARLSKCNCYCHGAGHQIDLITRAVSCTTTGENNIAQLLEDGPGTWMRAPAGFYGLPVVCLVGDIYEARNYDLEELGFGKL